MKGETSAKLLSVSISVKFQCSFFEIETVNIDKVQYLLSCSFPFHPNPSPNHIIPDQKDALGSVLFPEEESIEKI